MAFQGTRVFISRKDFPPQLIDSLQDNLRENGAEVCICSNPSCKASTDFHVLPSSEHERIEELRSQGCNVIGPDCVMRCAKEHRPFPKQGYTCCLAMEGVKVLATGFEKLEKLKIESLVSAMCGELESKTLTNASFIIAKDVLAAKYKFSVSNLRRPILKLDWLFQCWREHRLVPHEPFRLLPFTGLVICATNVPLEERKEIEEVTVKNGGIYSADLTRKCTHLIAYYAEGDKFKVARRWGTVKIVNRHWFGQCLTAKACLDEDLFPVNAGQEKPIVITQLSGPLPADTTLENAKSEVIMSSAPSVISITPSCNEEQVVENANDNIRSEISQDEQCISLQQQSLEDSLCEEENMYLSNCRIYFTGFTVPELRKYVNMVRDGGGTRHMEFSHKVTHVIVGKPTESEMKEVRKFTLWGTIQALWPSWLEECTQQKKEVAIIQRHLVSDGFLLKCSGSTSRDSLRMESMLQQLAGRQQLSQSQNSGSECNLIAHTVKTGNERVADHGKNQLCFSGGFAKDLCEAPALQDNGEPHHSLKLDHADAVKMAGSTHLSFSEQVYCGKRKFEEHDKGVCGTAAKDVAHVDNNMLRFNGSSIQSIDTCQVPCKGGIFDGYVFSICESFPMDRREEIVRWIVQGGGVMEKDVCANLDGEMQRDAKRRFDFIVINHGTKLTPIVTMNAKPISSHWIRFCLEEGKMLDLESHALYQPLQCQVPFPRFQTFRFCVSQYEDKDRLLLRNLCFVLGAKFTEKLNRKVTHLLCKVRDGQKYDAACKWGIKVVTAEWLFACVSQDKLAPAENFQPIELSAAEKDAGLLGMTQCPAQAADIASGERSSLWDVETQETRPGDTSASLPEESVAHLSERNKYVRSMLFSQASPSQAGLAKSDPWDEQMVPWSGVVRDETGEENPCPQGSSMTRLLIKGQHTSHGGAGSSSPSIATVDGGTLKQLAASDQTGDFLESEQRIRASSENENIEKWDRSSDVAAAIEGILAQTSKVKGSHASQNVGFDQELSPKPTAIRRNREESFKRPKLQSRENERTSEEKVSHSPIQDTSNFDESQIESQVIGYDEDHTGKHLIMERVRTRSMLTTDRNRAPRKSTAWKNDGLGRLFRVAEANK